MNLSLQQISEFVRYYCFAASQQGDGFVTLDTINQQSSNKISKQQALLALKDLEKSGLVEVTPNPTLGILNYRLTLGGYTRSEKEIRDGGSAFAKIANAKGRVVETDASQLEPKNRIFSPTVISSAPSAGASISTTSTLDDVSDFDSILEFDALGTTSGPNSSRSAERSTVADEQGLSQPTVEGARIPASDRYVSVRDNQPAFDVLVASLSRIRSEFAKDHNRGQYSNLPGVSEFQSEVGATLAQAETGHVRKTQLTDGLAPAITGLLLVAGAYPGLLEMLKHAAQALDMLLKSLGLA